MGASPSKKLYRAAKRSDIAGLLAAMEAGGDINFRNGKLEHTPLITAAKRGHTEVVKLLLAAGAQDLRSYTGDTALHFAARFCHLGTLAVLLDRGSDFNMLNQHGEKPIDVAAIHHKAPAVRMIEARTCPFFHHMAVEHVGFFRNSWEDKWVTVHRARPWDNPAISRTDRTVYFYKNTESPRWYMSMSCPEIRPLTADERDVVTFELVSALTSIDGKAKKPRSITCKLQRPIFTWLCNVLSSEFSTGRGSGFDEGGNIIYPATAQDFIQLHATERFTTRQLVAPLPPRFASRVVPQAVPQTSGLGASAAPVPVPAALPAQPVAAPMPVYVPPAAPTQAAARPVMSGAAAMPSRVATPPNFLPPAAAPPSVYPSVHSVATPAVMPNPMRPTPATVPPSLNPFDAAPARPQAAQPSVPSTSAPPTQYFASNALPDEDENPLPMMHTPDRLAQAHSSYLAIASQPPQQPVAPAHRHNSSAFSPSEPACLPVAEEPTREPVPSMQVASAGILPADVVPEWHVEHVEDQEAQSDPVFFQADAMPVVPTHALHIAQPLRAQPVAVPVRL